MALIKQNIVVYGKSEENKAFILPFIRALIKGTRSFVARALKNALMRENHLPALGS
jgi:hypothetical protein